MLYPGPSRTTLVWHERMLDIDVFVVSQSSAALFVRRFVEFLALQISCHKLQHHMAV